MVYLVAWLPSVAFTARASRRAGLGLLLGPRSSSVSRLGASALASAESWNAGGRRERLKCEFLPQLFSFVGTPRVPKWESKNGGSEAGQGTTCTLPYSEEPYSLGLLYPKHDLTIGIFIASFKSSC